MYCVIAIINILSHKGIYQWDFYGYYQCAKAYGNGINPYDTKAVSQIAKSLICPFVYPPITLFFFQIFTKLDYNLAFNLYIIIKCILMIGLIYLWRNTFLHKQVDLIFYLLCLFAFNATIYLDLSSGNISILEQFMIWLAFSYYLKRKFIYFCILIVLAAVFKIQPILFIFLLFFVENKSKYKLLIGSFMAFGIILLIQFISSPYLFSNFITNVANTVKEGGINNPSTFAFIRDLFKVLLGISNNILLDRISLLFHLVIVVAIIFISRSAYIHLKSVKVEDKEKWAIFLACLIYNLINIRFKDYSYILLILPTYFIIKTTSIRAKGLLLFIASISAPNVTLPGSYFVFNILWNYYPLFVAYLIWSLYLYEISYLYTKRLPTPNSL